jgi:CubicO group peptidase (beta-lactamase class C family)
MKSTYFLLPILLIFQWYSVNSQTKISKENPSAKVDELIAKYNFKNGPGLSVAVLKDGVTVYKKGFGIANLEYRIPITPKTAFQIASVSKQFTAFSILLLEQEGKLSLDDDVRKYLPEMSDYGHKITLRNLANHTSGIRDNSALANLIGTSEADMLSNEQAVKLITSQKELNFIPGDEFEYCNSGYILLAEIVKKVSGQSFANYVKTRIFNPLKMNNSQIVDDPETILKNRAYSYHKYNDIYYKSILNHSFVGSTNLNTTAEDLCLWAMNFEKKSIGNDTIFNKMKEKGKLNNGELIPYGLGIENTTYKGMKVLFHGGGDADYSSYILRIPEQNFSVIFLCNSHLFHPLDFVYTIVDFYLKDKEINTNSKPIINQTLLQNFVGDYEIFPGYIFSISNDNNTLFQQVKGDSTKVKLIQTSDYEFTYPNLPHSKIVFKNNNVQASEFLEWHIADFSYKGKRIEIKEFDKENINLNEFVGLYYNSELNTTYKFIIKENNLYATHCRNSDTLLTAFQPNIFTCDLGKVEFIRNNQNKVTGLYLMSQGIRKMKLEKIDDK